jgi:phage baseplate assembly protein W
MTQYKGFSTYNRPKHFRLTDFDLVKQDLTNHFNIRKGEKLMQPDFGTIIWDTLFDPFDDDTKNRIIKDVKRIIAFDGRVSAQNVIVTQFEKGIQIEIVLVYIANGMSGSMQLMFDQQNSSQLQML